MISIAFTCERAAATRDTQALLAAAPFSWTWKGKTIPNWSADLVELEQLKIDEVAKRAAWRNAATLWDDRLREIQLITREVKREGVFALGADPVVRRAFEGLRTDAASRDDIYNQGLAAVEVWKEANPGWSYSDDITSGGLGSLLAASLAQKQSHGTKQRAWKRASNKLLFKAQRVDAENVAWYAAASRKFRPGTEGGTLLRSSVPTTSRPEAPVGQGEITKVMAAGQEVHLDFEAPHATHFALLQQAPGSPVFLIVVPDTTQKSVTLHGLAPGLHRFKVVPSNSNGEGPESAAIEVTVAQQQAA